VPYRITYALELPADPAASARVLGTLFGALVETDVVWLRAKPETPALASAVRGLVVGPQRSPSYTEWKDVSTILQTGGADPVSLAAWAAAERVVGRYGAHPTMQGPDVRGLVRPGSARITFALDLFRAESNRKLSQVVLDVLLKALFRIDVQYLQANPNTPRVRDAGVLYMEEPPGQEEWQDVPTSLRLKRADCEDLACWRAAEIVVRDRMQAAPFFKEMRRPDGGYLYHILVGRADRRVEDPSQENGMR
jgi:hypothetical protein